MLKDVHNISIDKIQRSLPTENCMCVDTATRIPPEAHVFSFFLTNAPASVGGCRTAPHITAIGTCVRISFRPRQRFVRIVAQLYDADAVYARLGAHGSG